MPQWRTTALLAGLLGFTGVLMAALGAHAVSGLDAPASYRSWQAASLLHLVHAGLLLALAAHLRQAPSGAIALAGVAMFVGILLFSGTIYLRQIFGAAWAAPVTPFGGLILLGAWLWLVICLLRG